MERIFASGCRRWAFGSSAYRTQVALAECLRRETRGVDTQRMLGPRDRVQRTLVTANPKLILRLLPAFAHPLVARQGCAGISIGSTTGTWRRDRTAPGGRASPPLRTTSCIEFRCTKSLSSSFDLDKPAFAYVNRGPPSSSDAFVELRPAQSAKTLCSPQPVFS
jgi:hypothetical protein